MCYRNFFAIHLQMEGSEVVKIKKENSQLRIELAAQKAVYQKLRLEKEQLYNALKDAEEQIR